MSLFVKKVLLLSFLMLASCQSSFSKTHVRVTNSLYENLDLTIHCKSRDDDLGAHLLHHGAFTEWSFKVNIWGTTLFFCAFNWKNITTKWFDIYDAKRDAKVCNQCNWTITQDGPCLVSPTPSVKTKCYGWKQN